MQSNNCCLVRTERREPNKIGHNKFRGWRTVAESRGSRRGGQRPYGARGQGGQLLERPTEPKPSILIHSSPWAATRWVYMHGGHDARLGKMQARRTHISPQEKRATQIFGRVREEDRTDGPFGGPRPMCVAYDYKGPQRPPIGGCRSTCAQSGGSRALFSWVMLCWPSGCDCSVCRLTSRCVRVSVSSEASAATRKAREQQLCFCFLAHFRRPHGTQTQRPPNFRIQYTYTYTHNLLQRRRRVRLHP